MKVFRQILAVIAAINWCLVGLFAIYELAHAERALLVQDSAMQQTVVVGMTLMELVGAAIIAHAFERVTVD